MKKHRLIYYQDGDNPLQLAGLMAKKNMLRDNCSDHILNRNVPILIDEEGPVFAPLEDEKITLVVDGEFIDLDDLERPTMKLCRQADIIMFSHAFGTEVSIKKGAESFFEKHFGRIIEVNTLSRMEWEKEVEEFWKNAAR